VANQDERDERKKGESAPHSEGSAGQTGDPGRTPGTAEGDEQTIDEDLRQKEGQD